jgi:hypothetical protein
MTLRLAVMMFFTVLMGVVMILDRDSQKPTHRKGGDHCADNH